MIQEGNCLIRGDVKKLGLPRMEVMREDLHLLQILLESEEAPDINGKKIPVILAPGEVARAA